MLVASSLSRKACFVEEAAGQQKCSRDFIQSNLRVWRNMVLKRQEKGNRDAAQPNIEMKANN